jgi:hypothetical protein
MDWKHVGHEQLGTCSKPIEEDNLWEMVDRAARLLVPRPSWEEQDRNVVLICIPGRSGLQRTSKAGWFCVLLSVFVCSRSFAMNPDSQIYRYGHRRWKSGEAFPGGDVLAIAQDRGWLPVGGIDQRPASLLTGLISRNILAFRIATDWPCVQQGQLVTQRGASLAASTSTCWMGLFRCFEIGGRITLSADLFSALHRPQ